MESWENWLIAIPARLESTRLPEKPLADLGGKPLIIRVHEQLKDLKALGATIIVATDHKKVQDACQKFSVDAIMTDKDHSSGTDRCLQAAEILNHRGFILNVQGDEPFVKCEDLANLKRQLETGENPKHVMATLIHKNNSQRAYQDPNCVKVVINQDGQALYFSRSSIPFNRNEPGNVTFFWQHIGVYGFTYESLKQFCSLPESYLEKTERLEQLRALENGFMIKTTESPYPSLGIDTQSDLEVAREKFQNL